MPTHPKLSKKYLVHLQFLERELQLVEFSFCLLMTLLERKVFHMMMIYSATGDFSAEVP